MREAPAIGIDLGTTNSCVGVYRHGRVEIIVNDQGKKTTPSFVAFTEDGERLVGNIAKDQGVRNFNNTIFGVKRIIGRKFNDSSVQADIKLWPFSVIDDHTEPKVKVEINGQVKTFCPEEISSMVLSKMKEIAEDYLGETVENAVITVPAHFNDSQRRATKDAAIIAGLNVLRIINEPTAAAIAYGLDKKTSEDHNVLVFDLGGGTFDVSILNINDGVYEVKSTDGDAHLGGDDFDNRMVNHFILEFKHKHEIQKDLFQNRKLIQQVNTACERVKRTLSSSNQAYIEIRSLHEGIDLCSSITRPHFEELNADLFQSLIETVKRAILKAGMTKEQIDDVVLVGGSSRIPKIQQLIRDFFDGKVLNKSINPDEAVAYGAAVQADMLHGNKSKKLVLVDVTPFSLGIGCDEGCRNMRVIIERNTTIPTRKSQLMPMLYGHLTTAEIPVYEGEFDETEYNNLLGQFDLDGITPAPQGEPAIEITLDLDANGILNATAVEIKTGVRNQINISYDRNLRSEDEINRMIKENEEYRIKDKKRKLTSNAKCTLESYCINTKKIVGEKKLKYKINLFDKEMILKTCDETIHWLRSKEIGDLDEYELKQKELEGAFSLIISLAEEPGKKREKYREILNIREGASRKEINDAYRIAVKKYHPDVLRGNKEIGTWMFRMYTTAKDFFLGHM